MFKCYKRWEWDFNSELKDYMVCEYNFEGERIHYSNCYTGGTYTTAVPTDSYINCEYINGYPHFICCRDVIISEIDNFIKKKKMYDYDVIIRYGDTHPHKPLPKLAQIRGVAINNILSKMLLTSGTVESTYMLGDISIKSLESVFESELAHEVKKKILGGDELYESEKKLLSDMNRKASNGIRNLLCDLEYTDPKIVLESSIYKERDIYEKVMQLRCDSSVNEDGEIKYLLQEMMFIMWALRGKNRLISIIGENQYDHVLKTNELMNNNGLCLDAAFLTYGVCFCADSRDVDIWSIQLNEYLRKTRYRTGKDISIKTLLNLIYVCQNTSTQVYFDDLSKYDRIVNMYSEIKDCICTCEKNKNVVFETSSADLIYEMGLVYFQLQYSLKVCEPSIFFRYIYRIAKTYNNNIGKNKSISSLLLPFLEEAMVLLDLK